jgi:hypothetical protein
MENKWGLVGLVLGSVLMGVAILDGSRMDESYRDNEKEPEVIEFYYPRGDGAYIKGYEILDDCVSKR